MPLHLVGGSRVPDGITSGRDQERQAGGQFFFSRLWRLFPEKYLYTRKSPYEREHALGETRTHEIDFSRQADGLPSHRGAPDYAVCALPIALGGLDVCV